MIPLTDEQIEKMGLAKTVHSLIERVINPVIRTVNDFYSKTRRYDETLESLDRRLQDLENKK